MDLRIIEVHGSPYEMGRQRGSQLIRIIQRRLQQQLVTLRDLGHSISEIRALTGRFAEPIQAAFPNIWDEMRGIADGARISLDDLMFLNFRDMVLPAKPGEGWWTGRSMECTIFASQVADLPHGYTRVLVCKNADVPVDYQDYWTIVKATPTMGNAYVAVSGFPEMPGGSEGMNADGLCGGGAGVFTWDGYAMACGSDRFGIPGIMLYGEMLTRCHGVDDAVQFLTGVHTGPWGRNCLITDRIGEIVLLEKSTSRSNVAYSGPGPIAAATVFQSKRMAHLSASPLEDPSGHGRARRVMQLQQSPRTTGQEIRTKRCADTPP
jgi:predicted choloylglycine hydrolase